MADELERVRISAAELRAEASNFITDCDNVKELKEEGKKHQPREGKRPDLQRYKPGSVQSRKHKDSVEDDALGACLDPVHAYEDCNSDTDIKRHDSSPTSTGSYVPVVNNTDSAGEGQLKTKPHNAKEDTSGENHQLADDNVIKSTDTPRSPKQSRKMRKPDREIYQPGSRRSQSNKETGTGKGEGVAKDEKTRKETLSGKSIEKDDLPVEEVREKEEKRRNRRGKDGKKKQDQGKQNKESVDTTFTNKTQTDVHNITGKVRNLSISDQAGIENEGSKEGGGRDGANRRRKSGGEGRKDQARGCDGGMPEDKIKERGKSKSGKEKDNTKKEEVERGSETTQSDRKVKKSEGKQPRNMRDKEWNRDQTVTRDKRGIKPKDSKGEKGKASERADSNKVNSSSKRYSQSDIRRPRNRTYSTSSASSGTSMDGFVEAERLRGDCQPSNARTAEKTYGQREFVRGSQVHSRRRTARTLSSTDSLEENEAWERENRRDVRDKDIEDSRSTNRRLAGGSRGRGGILKVSLEKTASSSSGVSEQQASKKTQNPRGRGRGILILPAHTDLKMTSEPGPQVNATRGGMSLGRGRGGRGGGTRRLWDPNNPDKKPALQSSQQSQHASLQHALYLQQGGCGPLHFLDTDDEATGSPPVRQGEYSQNQQAAAMAYYKFQNSDNPYCYPLPGTSPNTPPRYPYPYNFTYQIPGSNGMYPASAMTSYYGPYGQGGQGYPSSGGSALTPEETEVQTRGEMGKLLRLADSQELQISNLLSRDRLSAEGLERMAHVRAELLTLYERVILTDIEFSDSQNVDQALWKNVFYQVIERFRQLLKDPASDTAPQIKAMLMSILEEGALFFESLLQKLQTAFQFKLEDYMDCMAIRARPLRKTVKYALISAQRCMICQGDIARYREQASDSANYGKARSWYLKAQQIAPKNGRPYNQLALLAVYTKRKLDAVYYYMRSLAASNPILTAKESLMSLFEEAKRKADQIEHRQKQDSDGGTRGPRGHAGGRRGEETARVEIWIRPSGHPGTSRTAGSESGKDSEQDGELGTLSASDLNKRFILSFLHAHGKLFTKVGMESFPAVASKVLQEFRALLQHSPSPLGSTRMLQIVTINMFTIHNAQIRAEGQGETRSVLEEQTTSLGLAMFGLLVQRCTELLKETPTEPIPAEELGEFDEMDDEEGMVRVSAFPSDIRELLPSIKVWSDWMLGHPDQWNPPPCSMQGSPDVWQCLADLCNSLARVYDGEAPLYKADVDGEGDEELRVLQLEEDKMLAGFVPLLAAPQDPCYIDKGIDTAIAADCKRVTVLKYFLEALCGQEEPLLAFKGGKYISMAMPSAPKESVENRTQELEDDVIVEESSLSASEGEIDGEMEADGSEDDIRELRARRHALAHKLAQQQKRRDKIQAVLQTGGQLEIEIRPFYLVPDTNGFIDHLHGLRKLLACGTYVLVVPLIVITELDGLAKGQDNREGNHNDAHIRQVQERSRAAVMFLEKAFESRDPCIRALTSRGNTLDSIAFRSEDISGQKGNNDDVILSCCLHYCQDKAKDFMPTEKNGPVRLRREVVLLTDDRNLRVKALTRNVPVRDIPAFLSWAKVG